MASTATFSCACGVQKKSTNHWILAMKTGETLRFLPWDGALAQAEDVVVLCGERCAAALLSRSLGEWKRGSMEARRIGLAA